MILICRKCVVIVTSKPRATCCHLDYMKTSYQIKLIKLKIMDKWFK